MPLILILSWSGFKWQPKFLKEPFRPNLTPNFERENTLGSRYRAKLLLSILTIRYRAVFLALIERFSSAQ